MAKKITTPILFTNGNNPSLHSNNGGMCDDFEEELNGRLRDLTRERKNSGCKPPFFLGDQEALLSHSSCRTLGRDIASPSPRQDERHRAERKQEALREMTEHFKGILSTVGEDPTRQGLLKTPERAARAMLYFTKGYDEDISG